MSTNTINRKIVGYKVKADAPEPLVATPEPSRGLHEDVPRPENLIGPTYKIKPAGADCALYITINNMEIDGRLHPFEMFINSKDMSHYQWVVALTRVISAVFRKGGDVTFLAEELKSIFDPKGGYWSKGVYVPSLVAEIGYVVEKHLKDLGLLETEELSDHQKQILDEKRKEFEAVHGETNEGAYPERATLCAKCNTKAVILMDGCATCLSCMDSKCG
jgi:hypothetical protein